MIKSIPAHVLGLMILTPALVAFGQVLFKMSGQRLAAYPGSGFRELVLDPVFISAMALYAGATFLWVYVLKAVPLSYAYSFMAVTYLLVPLFAVLWLGETLSLKYFLGLGLVLAGLFTLWS
ncbi:MAG: transporter [Hyphomonas sp.]|jgi:undecaprenyl phosphate-alpha-L-ara4N flippase subunit ArnE